MTEMMRPRVKYVIGPDGSPLTIADLPPANTRRWVIRRKAEVVAAVRGGLLSLEEACERYTLTVEEFLSWQSSINDHGLAGLRTTRIQQYRRRRFSRPRAHRHWLRLTNALCTGDGGAGDSDLRKTALASTQTNPFIKEGCHGNYARGNRIARPLLDISRRPYR
jgi:hypothetical protein